MPSTGTVGSLPSAAPKQPENAMAGMTPQDLERMIQAAAQRIVEGRDAEATAKKQEAMNGPMLPPALKTYLCDRFPNARIQELDFSTVTEKGKHPPIKGQFITFRLGKFRAMTQNQVDQIEWMMSNPTHDRVGNVIGGFPYIVEDIGEKAYICRKCDPVFVTTSPERFRAHNRAMHSVANLDD